MLAMGGIVVLAILAMAIVAAIYPEKGPAAADTFPQPQATAPVGEPTGPPPPSVAAQPGSTDRPSGRPPATTSPPVPGAVTGGYAVTHSAKEWGDRFEVRITLHNSSATAQQWVLTLVYPQPVNGIAAAWIEGHPPPSQIPNRPTFTMTSNEAIPAGGSIVLWAQFTLDQGAGVDITECRVNGTPCQMP